MNKEELVYLQYLIEQEIKGEHPAMRVQIYANMTTNDRESEIRKYNMRLDQEAEIKATEYEKVAAAMRKGIEDRNTTLTIKLDPVK